MDYIRSLILFTVSVGISACAMPPEKYRDGKPYQTIEVSGEPKEIAECVQQSLVSSGWIGTSLGRDPKTGLYTLTSGDAYSGVLMAIAFDPINEERTKVSTRGIAYIFGPIPPWSKQVIESAKNCEGQT